MPGCDRAAAIAQPTPGSRHNKTTYRGRPSDGQDLRELWRYRELFYFWPGATFGALQATVAGIAWVLIKAMVTLLVLTVGIAGSRSCHPTECLSAAGVHAMLPWQFFAVRLRFSNSLVGNSDLIAKIYFPRLIVPGSAMIVNLVDFAISCSCLCSCSRGMDSRPTGAS